MADFNTNNNDTTQAPGHASPSTESSATLNSLPQTLPKTGVGSKRSHSSSWDFGSSCGWNDSIETLVSDVSHSLDGGVNMRGPGGYSVDNEDTPAHVCGLVIQVKITRNNHHNCPGCHEKGAFHVEFQEECELDSVSTSYADIRTAPTDHDHGASSATKNNQSEQDRACHAKKANRGCDGSTTRAFDFAHQSRTFEYGHSSEHHGRGFFISTAGLLEFMDKYSGTIEDIEPEYAAPSVASSMITAASGGEDFGGMETTTVEDGRRSGQEGVQKGAVRKFEDDGRE